MRLVTCMCSFCSHNCLPDTITAAAGGHMLYSLCGATEYSAVQRMEYVCVCDDSGATTPYPLCPYIHMLY